MTFKLTDQIINPTELRKELLSLSAGAYCSYEGWVRDHNEGKVVKELHYSSYVALAPAIAQTILDEAKAKFGILQAAVVHRTGALTVGDIAVWVGVTAHHRGDTFLASRYIIDNVKHRLPIWKKEIYADGTAAWIESNHCGCADPANVTKVAGASSSKAQHQREQDAPLLFCRSRSFQLQGSTSTGAGCSHYFFIVAGASSSKAHH